MIAPGSPRRSPPTSATVRRRWSSTTSVDEPLVDLRVDGLVVRHAGSGRGIDDVDLVVRRGELVVVTGRVGAGKSTLLRAVLGLVARDAGTIRWNGAVVDDPATVLVPPRVAYLPQVPRLFSEPLADTVLLGRVRRRARAGAVAHVPRRGP